jgi:hypothetical protein
LAKQLQRPLAVTETLLKSGCKVSEIKQDPLVTRLGSRGQAFVDNVARVRQSAKSFKCFPLQPEQRTASTAISPLVQHVKGKLGFIESEELLDPPSSMPLPS